MSHSTVLVIGEDPEKQLEPFAEQWDSSTPPHFAQFGDETETVMKGWEEDTVTCIKVRGKWQSKNATRASRPDDMSEREIPVKEYYGSLESYVEGYHGYQTHNGRYGYWHNPQAKWDWYSLGGRWTGMFKMKPAGEGTLGEPGAFGRDEPVPDGRADQAYKGDIDFMGMRMQSKVKAHERYDEYLSVTEGLEVPPTWEETRTKYCGALEEGGELDKDKMDAAREEYREYPWVKALNEARLAPFMGDDHEEFCVHTGGREAYVARAMVRSFQTFAVLKDGEWYERGDMGWFGFVSNEKDTDTWDEEFSKLVSELPSETLLSVYDVHI
jgi:hypothetical protein